MKGIGNESIWVSDANGLNAAPLVQDSRTNIFPEWSPDGSYIAYLSEGVSFDAADAEVTENWEYRRIPASGGGAPQTLLTEKQLDFRGAGVGGRLLLVRPNRELGRTRSANWQDCEAGYAFQQCGSAAPDDVRFAGWAFSGLPSAGTPRERSERRGLGGRLQKSRAAGFSRMGCSHRLRAGGEIYFLEGKPDLNGSLWKVGWDGRDLARASTTIPILFNLNYNRTYLGNQFAVSPDGRHVAFQTEQVLEENLGMIENVR